MRLVVAAISALLMLDPLTLAGMPVHIRACSILSCTVIYNLMLSCTNLTLVLADIKAWVLALPLDSRRLLPDNVRHYLGVDV